MIKNDKWILEEAQKGMVTPYETGIVRTRSLGDRTFSAISWGIGSYGLDIRLSPDDFMVFRRIPGAVVDPKDFKSDNLVSVPLQSDHNGQYFILPGNSYGLGVSLEKIKMPPNTTACCVGKSTYARVGVIANVTPIEASWQGQITLEFSNASSADVRIYANEGVCQLLFFEGEQCQTTYADRGGKYQNQSGKITFSRV